MSQYRISPFSHFGFPYVERRSGPEAWTPRVDVRETEESYVFDAELPGVDPADIDLTFDNDTLTISGKKVTETETEAEGVHARERVSGSFARRFRLPDHVDAAGITAKADNGVLQVTVPKAAAHQPVRVAIAS